MRARFHVVMAAIALLLTGQEDKVFCHATVILPEKAERTYAQTGIEDQDMNEGDKLAVDTLLTAQVEAQFLGGLLGGGSSGGGSGGGSGSAAQNTPSINIIDNARIMMLPGAVPGMGMMSQENAEESNEADSTLAQTNWQLKDRVKLM